MRKPSPIIVVLAEGALAVSVVLVGGWLDRSGRTAGPEAPLAAYAAALGRYDLQGALDQLAPEVRGDAASFVEQQLGNRYRILESAVRSASVLEGSGVQGPDRAAVVITVDVLNEDGSGWRTTEELPVGRIGGGWVLLRAPLEPK